MANEKNYTVNYYLLVVVEYGMNGIEPKCVL